MPSRAPTLLQNTQTYFRPNSEVKGAHARQVLDNANVCGAGGSGGGVIMDGL
jgi:hypothetical protein